MSEGWLSRNGRLHTDVLNLLHHVFSIKVFLICLHVVQNRCERALGALFVFNSPTLDKVARLLVDGVVGQVHEQIVEVFLLWRRVGLSGEPGQALLEHEDTQRVHAIDQHVDTQVKLQPFDQVRLRHVALGHILVA